MAPGRGFALRNAGGAGDLLDQSLLVTAQHVAQDLLAVLQVGALEERADVFDVVLAVVIQGAAKRFLASLVGGVVMHPAQQSRNTGGENFGNVALLDLGALGDLRDTLAREQAANGIQIKASHSVLLIRW